jgi:hypothetical protein
VSRFKLPAGSASDFNDFSQPRLVASR